MNVSGYFRTNVGTTAWSPTPAGNIGTQIRYFSSADNTISISGLNLTFINGANSTIKPTTGVGAGFLATVTLFYI